MRRIATLLAAAAVVAVGLSTAPAQAHDGWGDYQWGNHGWGEDEWSEHHDWYPSYYNYGYNYGYYAPPRYYAPPSVYYYTPGVTIGFGFR